MNKDKANIFKLDTDELQKYLDHEFDDCMPGANEFAECLKCSVLTKETPFVLLLEDKFGMGKTHFSTRFAYYLKNCKIDTIYFSAWENDYIEQPFISFSKEIIKYINSSIKDPLNKSKDLFKAIYELTLNLASTVKIPLDNNLSLDMGNAINAGKTFINHFIKYDDYLTSFKKALTNFINNLPNHRLVIIVDELDRCRPDYAMKTLEIIKHFFDIEGLFIIVPTNKRSLQKCVQSLYGIEEDLDNLSEYEFYINKFFTDEINLFRPNYLKLTQEYLPNTSFKQLIDSNKMTLEGKYNSLATLQEKIAKFSEEFKLTMREVVKVCKKAIYFCNYIDRKVDCEYLAYLLCLRSSRIENNNCRIQSAHPLSVNSIKKELLKFVVPEKVYQIGNTIYQQRFMEENKFFANRQFSSYKEFDDFYNYFSKQPKGFEFFRSVTDQFMHQYYKYDFLALAEYIENKKNEIDEYRNTWDSDDNDPKLAKYYRKIIENESSIHAEKLTLNKGGDK